ncbi:MAG: DNA repair protein RadA [Bdellovibrionales bacterium]|nr:DNA repair protein RadA [Bdellovibrionales bacterium]
MAAKQKVFYICQDCGYQSAQWYGRCPDCQGWNRFVEEREQAPQAPGKNRRSQTQSPKHPQAVSLHEFSPVEFPRISFPWGEVNRVLGGGLTLGSVVLLAGQPGIGKSTLLLQLFGQLDSKQDTRPLLYVSGEESNQQINVRAQRLGIKGQRISLLGETNVVRLVEQIRTLSPEIVIIDSVQTLFHPDLSSVPGSVSQVRESTDHLVRCAKEMDIPFFLVGHVTKEGSVAGPMTLEHLVDTVLVFEGDQSQNYRLLRSSKNRFGPTDEVGVFEMVSEGLQEVKNPSELFLRERAQNVPGTVVFPLLEGTRPLLIEVQALATDSSYGVPMRNAVGFDKNRLTMLLAVLEKRAGLHLSGQDVYVNVVGGIKASEPAADLAVCAAVISSYTGKTLPDKTVVFGEIGLTGEVRSVQQASLRLREVQKLGFTRGLLPSLPAKASFDHHGIEMMEISSIDMLLSLLSMNTSS